MFEIPVDVVAEYRYREASIFVRTRADGVDRALYDSLMKQAVRELVAGGKPQVSRSLAAVFVCGWTGVVRDGKPLPYTWQLLEAAFPPEAIDELARFVAAHVDILKL